jgi:predicted RNA-binding Zn ribbon-like protein
MKLMVTQEMRLGPSFQFIAGNLALDFANTVHSVGEEYPQDDLRSYEDLMLWAQAANLKGSKDRGEDASALALFKDLREVIYEIFSAVSGGRNAGAETLARFNGHLQRAISTAQICRADGNYSLRSASRSLNHRLQFEITRAAAELLLSDKLDHIRQCAGDTCTWLFLDTSRNGTRKWCEMQACGNRAKIRRFRKRLPG